MDLERKIERGRFKDFNSLQTWFGLLVEIPGGSCIACELLHLNYNAKKH